MLGFAVENMVDHNIVIADPFAEQKVVVGFVLGVVEFVRE